MHPSHCFPHYPNTLAYTHCTIKKAWGLADAVVLESLAAGCDGIWCSLCEEGAAQGHSCSAVMLANLARLGNKDVTSRFVCAKLVDAARRVTSLTTRHPVHDRQVVYGPRAMEAVFSFGGIAGGETDHDDLDIASGLVCDAQSENHVPFDLAHQFSETYGARPIRIHALSTGSQFQTRLVQLFGEDEAFSLEVGEKLKAHMMVELQNGVKEEYTSSVGMARLFLDVMGSTTPSMEVCRPTIIALTSHLATWVLVTSPPHTCRHIATHTHTCAVYSRRMYGLTVISVRRVRRVATRMPPFNCRRRS